VQSVASGDDDERGSIRSRQQLADGQSAGASAYDEARLIFMADLQKTRVVIGGNTIN
jgi:hypothetical protein